MSVSVWQQRPEVAPTYQCDVAVIGAGIIGAYSAYRLAAEGRRVAVLESRFPAAGATGRNAGFCLMGAADNYATGVERFGRERARALWLLTRENQRKMRELVTGFGTPYVPCGSAILAIDDQESRLLAQAYELMLADGIQVDFSPQDPFGRGFGSAILQNEDFGLDPAALVQRLLDNAPGQRLRLFAPAEVYAIHEQGGGRLLVEARGIRVECEQVALCTNAYSRLVSPYFDDKVAPVRGQILMTAPLRQRVLDRLAYANYGYEYFRQLEDGSFLLGGGRSRHKDLEVGFDDAPTVWLQNTLEEFLSQFFPDVASQVPVVRRWAGTMGFSADGLPLAGQLPAIPGPFPPVSRPYSSDRPAAVHQPGPDQSASESQVWFAVGFTGHGLGWGLVTADFMLDQMLGRRSDGGLFDARRLNSVQAA